MTETELLAARRELHRRGILAGDWPDSAIKEFIRLDSSHSELSSASDATSRLDALRDVVEEGSGAADGLYAFPFWQDSQLDRGPSWRESLGRFLGRLTGSR